LGLSESKYYKWKKRYGHPNQHNAPIPREHWLDKWEKQVIISYYIEHPLEGYRRLTFMMLDENVVAVSPSSVYRVLKKEGLLKRKRGDSKKGSGFKQPLDPHEHWHIDVSYINICGTFYYLCSVLDGCSRYSVHWNIEESMTEAQIEIILQKAKEIFPKARPRIISDNGPQFIAKDFKEFIKISGMTHVRTSPFYPQSNGKIERWHQSLKKECIRPKTPLSLKHAKCIVTEYIEYYNNSRLHSAIGYIAPVDRLEGRQELIFQQRKQKLERAKLQRVRRSN
jgi:transposase InsO family protein